MTSDNRTARDRWVERETALIWGDAMDRLRGIDDRTAYLLSGLARWCASLEFVANGIDDGCDVLPEQAAFFCTEVKRFWSEVVKLAGHNDQLRDSRFGDCVRHFTHTATELLSEMPAASDRAH